jgi:hypothetical protein
MRVRACIWKKDYARLICVSRFYEGTVKIVRVCSVRARDFKV